MVPLHRLRPAATLLSLVVLLFFIEACGGVSATEVQYAGANGVSLVGTLVMPVHAAGQRVPGVIIIAGSGSADRDGNAPSVTTDLYKQIAALLAQDGIASLRYDKRGVGKSTLPSRPADPRQPTPSELAALQDFIDWKNFVEDAMATASELLAQTDIDPAHFAIIGHSEGGIIASELAGTQVGLPHRPSAVVLLSSPGRSYDTVVRDQLARQLQMLQASEAVSQDALSRVDAIAADLRQGGQYQSALLQSMLADSQIPIQFSTVVAKLYSVAMQKFWSGALQVQPASDIAQYDGPVLVLQGSSDTQVSPILDAPALNQALSARMNGIQQLSIIPDTSHDLKAVQDPSADPGFAGDIVPAAAAALRMFIKTMI